MGFVPEEILILCSVNKLSRTVNIWTMSVLHLTPPDDILNSFRIGISVPKPFTVKANDIKTLQSKSQRVNFVMA